MVHPSPTFPDLFASVLADQGHRRDLIDVEMAARVVSRRFLEAAREGDRWTLTAERSRVFWTGVYEQMLEALGLPARDGLRDTLYRAFTEIDNYALFEDVPPVLSALEATGVTLGIVSNFEAWLEELLGALKVRDTFPVRVISGIEGIEKPEPAIYRRALERAQVDARDAAFVGDNPMFDVDPPLALGLTPVLIDRRGRYPDHEGARIVDLLDLPGLLEAM